MPNRDDFVRATTLELVAPDGIHDEVQVGFILESGASLVIAVPRGVLGILLTRIAAAAANLNPSSGSPQNALAQPMRVQSFRGFGLHDGRKGISFEAANVDLPLLFSESQLADLAKIAAELPDQILGANGMLQ
jgi:hypothetical protein